MNLPALGYILKHPLTVLVFAGAGVYVGIAHPSWTTGVTPFGNIYLAMLQMVALPIILCAVISSVGSLLFSRLAAQTLRRFTLLLIGGPLFAAGLGLLCGVIAQPGKNLPPEAETIFGRLISAETVNALGAGQSGTKLNSFWSLANQIVTDNIFASLTDGKSLQVLFFSILLGVALGLEKHKKSKIALITIEAIFDALLKIINWLVYLLPFGLFSLLAAQSSDINPAALSVMLRLILLYAVACLLLLLICNTIIALRTKVGFWATLGALRESLFIAAGSSNSFAALPSALRGLQLQLHLDRRITDLVTPLALNLLPLATIVYFVVCSLFIAQISDIELSAPEYFLLFLGSIFAGFAAASLPAAAGVAAISIVLEPLGLPVGVAIALLIAIDPILDPFNAAVDVHVACTAATLVADPPVTCNSPAASPVIVNFTDN